MLGYLGHEVGHNEVEEAVGAQAARHALVSGMPAAAAPSAPQPSAFMAGPNRQRLQYDA